MPKTSKKQDSSEKKSDKKDSNKRSKSEEETYLVESILEKKKINGVVKYKVKWQDYDEDQCTWEPAANLVAVKYMIDEFNEEEKAKKNEEKEVEKTKSKGKTSKEKTSNGKTSKEKEQITKGKEDDSGKKGKRVTRKSKEDESEEDESEEEEEEEDSGKKGKRVARKSKEDEIEEEETSAKKRGRPRKNKEEKEKEKEKNDEDEDEKEEDSAKKERRSTRVKNKDVDKEEEKDSGKKDKRSRKNKEDDKEKEDEEDSAKKERRSTRVKTKEKEKDRESVSPTPKKKVKTEKDSAKKEAYLKELEASGCGHFDLGDVPRRIAHAKKEPDCVVFTIEWMPRAKNGKTPANSYMNNMELRKYDQDLLLDFYEARLKFVKPNSAKTSLNKDTPMRGEAMEEEKDQHKNHNGNGHHMDVLLSGTKSVNKSLHDDHPIQIDDDTPVGKVPNGDQHPDNVSEGKLVSEDGERNKETNNQEGDHNNDEARQKAGGDLTNVFEDIGVINNDDMKEVDEAFQAHQNDTISKPTENEEQPPKNTVDGHVEQQDLQLDSPKEVSDTHSQGNPL